MINLSYKLNKKNYNQLNILKNLYLKTKFNFFKMNKNLNLGTNYKVTIELIEKKKKRYYSFQGKLIAIKKKLTYINSLTFQLLFDNIIITYNIPIQIIKNLAINGFNIYSN